MKKALLTALFALGFAAPAFALGAGDKAPDFQLPSVREKTKAVKLSDYKGKVVLVNFWATWCPPCRGEIPGFEKVYQKYAKQGFVILGLSVDDSAAPVKQFLKDNKMSYPVALSDRKVPRSYGGIRAIPSSFLIDKKGIVKKTVVGGIEEKDLEALVKPLL